MDQDTPAHRHSHPIRSGDDHLIDPKSGELRNLDQERRGEQAPAAAKPKRVRKLAVKKPSPPKPTAAAAPDTSAQ